MSDKEIHVPVSAGELLDKITILRIKSRRIGDPAKLANVRKELAALEAIWRRSVTVSLAAEEEELTRVNQALWEIEDHIRDQERERDFGPQFVALARRVYITNDQRAEIKRRVNLLLGSALVEEKSYRNYSIDSGPVPAW